MNDQPDARSQLVIPQEPPRELLGAVPVGSVYPNLGRGSRLQQNRRRGHRGPEPTEPATQTAAEVQHPKVQTRARLDEDATATGHNR